MAHKVAAIICAAGPGTRFGGKKKKQFDDVGGRAVFMRSVELFAERPEVTQVLLAIPSDEEELVSIKWGPNLEFFGVKTYFGGAERFETVAKGLEMLKDDIDFVAIHDACRCCITEKIVNDVLAAAVKSAAAIPACRVTATVKRVADTKIVETVDRSDLYEAQTPQIFARSLLLKAYDNLKNLDSSKISDDAQLVEALGHDVTIVESDSSNIKITYRCDIAIAQAIIRSRPKDKPDGPIGAYIEAQW